MRHLKGLARLALTTTAMIAVGGMAMAEDKLVIG